MSEQVAIVDPVSLNGFLENLPNSSFQNVKSEIVEFLQNIDVDYYLSGDIKISNNNCFFNCNIVKTSNSEIICPINEKFASGMEYPQMAEAISNKIFDFFQIQKLESSGDKSIDPMTKGTKNISALKSFIIATEHIYNLNTGEAIKFLRNSISMDSSFVSPRIWLVSYLYQIGESEEAMQHFEIAKKFEYKATLVEQIMIGWAEALLKNDIEGQIHFLKIGLKYFPQNNITLYQLGCVYLFQDNYPEALK
jgi:tetratricopeptide (TPR) repeat protein